MTVSRDGSSIKEFRAIRPVSRLQGRLQEPRRRPPRPAAATAAVERLRRAHQPHRPHRVLEPPRLRPHRRGRLQEAPQARVLPQLPPAALRHRLPFPQRVPCRLRGCPASVPDVVNQFTLWLSAFGHLCGVALRLLGFRRLLARIKESKVVNKVFFVPLTDDAERRRLSDESLKMLDASAAACRWMVKSSSRQVREGIYLRKAGQPADAASGGRASPRLTPL